MLLNINRTRQYLSTFDFKNLFIEELGWDNYQKQHVIELENQRFLLTGVAEKRGVGAFVCTPDSTSKFPDRGMRRKIDRQLGRLIHEHLIIYPDLNHTQQIWQTVTHRAGKPIASPEHTYYVGQPGDALIQKLQEIAFSIEEEESLGLVDVVARMGTLLKERVTKKFYDRFEIEHDFFLQFISGIDDSGLQRWYASVMLNRLMFIYFIQGKGFLDGKTDYLKQKLFASMKKEEPNQYYRTFLRTLFFEGLATEQRSPEVTALLGKV